MHLLDLQKVILFYIKGILYSRVPKGLQCSAHDNNISKNCYSVVEKIRQTIMREFELTTLYFTAPTFLTRLVGNVSW